MVDKNVELPDLNDKGVQDVTMKMQAVFKRKKNAQATPPSSKAEEIPVQKEISKILNPKPEKKTENVQATNDFVQEKEKPSDDPNQRQKESGSNNLELQKP